MNYLLAWFRIILLVCTISIHVAVLMTTIIFMGRDVRRGFKIRKSCIRSMTFILGFKIRTHGKINQIDPALYISNHRCFSDPLLALYFFEFYPIGKAEIENYPLIGLAAKESGVFFVQRENKESRGQVKSGIKQALQQGLSVFLCPEGTTATSQTTKEFKKGAFEVAVELNIPIVPLAMVYADPGSDFWLPKDSLIRHFIRQFGKWRTTVDVYFPASPFISTDSIVLMQACKDWIDEKLLTVTVPDQIASLPVGYSNY